MSLAISGFLHCSEPRTSLRSSGLRLLLSKRTTSTHVPDLSRRKAEDCNGIPEGLSPRPRDFWFVPLQLLFLIDLAKAVGRFGIAGPINPIVIIASGVAAAASAATTAGPPAVFDFVGPRGVVCALFGGANRRGDDEKQCGRAQDSGTMCHGVTPLPQ